MFFELEIFLLSFVLFLLLFCAFEAFDRLSGSQIRKLEETDPELAVKLNAWLGNSDSIRAVFKLLLFILASILGMFSFLLSRSWLGNGVND